MLSIEPNPVSRAFTKTAAEIKPRLYSTPTYIATRGVKP